MMKLILKTVLSLLLLSCFACQNQTPNNPPTTETSEQASLGEGKNVSSAVSEMMAVVPQPNISRIFDPKLISTLQDNTQRSAKLNDLIKNMENYTYYINDSIVFSKTENQNKNISLNIKTQCIESKTQKKFTKDISLQYKNEIMLIELIPKQLFSYGNAWWLNKKTEDRYIDGYIEKQTVYKPNYTPTCSFHFEAKNKAGDVHYFEFPHLPVSLFHNSLNLSLIQQEQNIPSDQNEIERVEQFPIFKFDKIEEYAVISGKNTKVNELKLICKTFNLSFDVDNLIYYDLWKLQGWTSIEEEDRINQPCRFVSFNDERIVGVSQIFPIVFPLKRLKVRLITDYEDIEELQEKHHLRHSNLRENINKLKSDFKRDKELGRYHNIAVLEIDNSGIDQVHLYIPDTSFKADVHFLYENFPHKIFLGTREFRGKEGVYVTKEGDDEGASRFILTPSLVKHDETMEVKGKDYHIVYKGQQAFLTVEAGAEVFIPLSVDIYEQCRIYKWMRDHTLKGVEHVGIIFEGDNTLSVYQVLDATDKLSAEQTIISSSVMRKRATSKRRRVFQLGVDVGAYSNKERKSMNKHFYQNSCEAFQTGMFDIQSRAKPGAWRVRWSRRKKNIGSFYRVLQESIARAESTLIKRVARKLFDND